MRLSLDLGLGSVALNQGGEAPAPAYDPVTALGASLLGWWNADRSDLITLSGSQITSWRDVVAGYDMLQATSSARPLWSATSFNGAPGATFDGVDDEMTLESVPWPTGASPADMWATVQQDALAADTSVRLLFAYGGTASSSRRTLQRVVVSGTNRGRVTAGNGTSELMATGTATDFSGRHVIRGDINATDLELTMNDGTPTNTAVVPNTGAVRTRMGANTSAVPSGFWNGKVRDLIVTGPLTVGQASDLRTFLLSRRAL